MVFISRQAKGIVKSGVPNIANHNICPNNSILFLNNSSFERWYSLFYKVLFNNLVCAKRLGYNKQSTFPSVLLGGVSSGVI